MTVRKAVLTFASILLGMSTCARAASYPDSYLNFVVAVPNAWEADFVSALVGDTRYAASNCVNPTSAALATTRRLEAVMVSWVQMPA